MPNTDMATPKKRTRAPTKHAVTKANHLSDPTLFRKFVHIKVGPLEEAFGVHRDLLCKVSSYFNAALTGEFKEAADEVIILDEEDPDVFSRFNGWLYTRILLTEDEAKDSDYLDILIDVYLFAERRFIPSLQNDAIDAILRVSEATETLITAKNVKDIWRNTMSSSKIRRFAIDQQVYLGDIEDNFGELGAGGREYPCQFLAAVAQGLFALLNIDDAEAGEEENDFDTFELWDNRCARYHTHEPTDPPCKGQI